MLFARISFQSQAMPWFWIVRRHTRDIYCPRQHIARFTEPVRHQQPGERARRCLPEVPEDEHEHVLREESEERSRHRYNEDAF